MKVGALISGGKDSLYSAHLAMQYGWDVSCLITLKSDVEDSWMFHTPNIGLVKYQAESMNVPLIMMSSSGVKEEELEDLFRALALAKKEHDIRGVTVGAILSDYQQERVNRICARLDLKVYAPLWHKDQRKLVLEMIDSGFEIVISSIAAYGLDVSYLGCRLDKEMVAKLVKLNSKFGMHIGGEGGEYESLVVDCPMFSKRLEILEGEKVMESETTGRFNIKKVKLVEK